MNASFRLLSSAVLLLGLAGCASHHAEGVKSDMMTQWVSVNAGTKMTTDAARHVLEDRDLKDVKAESTEVDGMASGKMANGSKVKVSIKQKSNDLSEVSVTVGTMGDPKLGADIANQIKMRAESR